MRNFWFAIWKVICKDNVFKYPKLIYFMKKFIATLLIGMVIGAGLGYFLLNPPCPACDECPVCDECETCPEPTVCEECEEVTCPEVEECEECEELECVCPEVVECKNVEESRTELDVEIDVYRSWQKCIFRCPPEYSVCVMQYNGREKLLKSGYSTSMSVDDCKLFGIKGEVVCTQI